MKFIRTLILQYKLGRIKDQAEAAIEQGREAGDDVFYQLYSAADKMIVSHTARYPGFNEPFPFMDDLRKLAFVSGEVRIKSAYAQAGLIAIFAISITGLLGALVNVSYHGWLNLFHWLHLVR